jgi:hypothetical protein
MRKRYVAFYWTRWVPPQFIPGNARKQDGGFTSLSEDPDEAAGQSRTIRYQRELIKRYVRSWKGVLVSEVVYLEKHLDRGSNAVGGPLRKAAALCHERQATLLYVDFWSEAHWRRHNHLLRMLAEIEVNDIEVAPVLACPIPIDGGMFDPIQHFQRWDQTMKHSRKSRDEAEAALRKIAPAHTGRGRYERIARELNEKDVPTLSRRTVWTAEIVRQLIKYRLPDLD